MRILSFGEQTLKDSDSIEALGRVVEAAAADPVDRPHLVVVVAALEGLRAALGGAAARAAEGAGSYLDEINTVRERILEVIRRLFRPREQSTVITAVQILLNDLEDILHGVQLIRECSERTRDLVLSFGVQISCILVGRYLERLGLAVRVEENPGIVLARNRYGACQVDYQASYRSIRETVGRGEAVVVAAGGIARNQEGAVSVMQQDGPDLSATLIAAALQAELVELWTDLDGVMSADPAYVSEAFVVPVLSYQEAMELSFFGARIVHSQALVPVLEAGVPTVIRNLNRPDQPGTLICRNPEQRQAAIVGIASIEPVALVNIEGGGMVGVPGIAARIFSTLARAAVNIIMISQASSEHSICVVFRQEEAARALRALQEELSAEIGAKQIQNFDLREDLAILAAIGENMRGTPGISGKLFSALGDQGINILAIAQGSSETNISFVITKASEPQALHTVHRAFLQQTR